MRQWQKFVLFALVFAGIPLLMAQTGPTVFTPRLTVSPGPLTVTTGATTVQDLTINGTCTGCTTTSPGGSNTQVQYNNSGAFGGDAGLTYVAGTDTLSVGTVTITTAATVAGSNLCRASGTNCPGTQNGITLSGGLYGIAINSAANTGVLSGMTATVNCTTITIQTLGGNTEGGIGGTRVQNGGNCTGTSNATTMTTNAWAQVSSLGGTVCTPIPVIDNGAVVQGNVCIDSSGNATFGVGLTGSGGFTASGTKGLPDNINAVFVTAGG